MGYNIEETHGKMELMEPTAQYHQERTSPTCSKPKTRLVAISTSHHLVSTRPLAALVASKSLAALESPYHFLLLPVITLYLPGTGTREAIGYALFLLLVMMIQFYGFVWFEFLYYTSRNFKLVNLYLPLFCFELLCIPRILSLCLLPSSTW